MLRKTVALAGLGLATFLGVVADSGAKSNVLRQVGRYKCDAAAPQVGLSTKAFFVNYTSYMGAPENNTAVIPIDHKKTTFALQVQANKPGRHYLSDDRSWAPTRRGYEMTLKGSSGPVVSRCKELPWTAPPVQMPVYPDAP